MELNGVLLNTTAIIAGGLLYMIYGGIYYSTILGKKKENGETGPFKYIFSVIVAFISSFLMSYLIGLFGADSAAEGLMVGFIIGILITMVYYKNTLFGLLTRKSFIIAIGDHLVIFTLLGLLHGWMN
ncbi:DUF1761 domain-containing protein [Fictibacillus sp. 26RED30]|jgi:Protein of unknown function (DUF1761)|uniref:DUF1761 domain-containing protein n=1 Tax=Fictibacillus sp. 26RED30 TaxID=2745877 RepID=UPI0018CD1EC4|nr:DUF1761 domain-containing protein [Fictibacillus sp. 26RED30]MBH0162225.1 DUF1761 domain-containing protein [Fictibacillus sp. 26RED30]